MKTRESQINFIKLNGVRLASCGWDGYKDKGRGLICVLSDLENELLHQVPFDFMPEIDASKLMNLGMGARRPGWLLATMPTRKW